MSIREKIIIAIIFMSIAIGGRLLPHVPNVAPIGALAMMSTLYISRRFGWALSLTALFISDLFIGFYAGGVMISVYGSFFLIAMLNLVSRRSNAPALAVRSIMGSVAFFTITNFAVWQFGTMYPHSVSGLIACYTAAIPFFRRTLIGDILYTALFVGVIQGVVALRRLDAVKLKTLRATRLTNSLSSSNL